MVIETDKIKSGSYRTDSQSFSRGIDGLDASLSERISILAHFLWDIREYRIKRSYVRKFETGYSTRSSRDGINDRTEDGTKVDRERPEEREESPRRTTLLCLRGYKVQRRARRSTRVIG